MDGASHRSTIVFCRGRHPSLGCPPRRTRFADAADMCVRACALVRVCACARVWRRACRFASATGAPWSPIPHGSRLRGISDAVSDQTASRLAWLTILHDLDDSGRQSANEVLRRARARAHFPLPSLSASSPTASGGDNMQRTISPARGGGSVGSQPMVVSTVPGVCNGNGDVGIGCGYDATRLELYVVLAVASPTQAGYACLHA